MFALSRTFIAAMLSSLPSTAPALQDEAEQFSSEIERYFDVIAESNDFMGTVVVAEQGRIIFSSSWGYRDTAAGEMHSASKPLMVASITKSFTAASIIHLVAAGRLDLDDQLSKYFPGFPKADKLKVRALLNEESGLGEPDYGRLLDSHLTLEALVDHIAEQPFKFEPYEGSAYSNSAYNLLARIVEIVSGESFSDFLFSTFFMPLEMSSTADFSAQKLNASIGAAYLPGPPPAGRVSGPTTNGSLSIGAGSLITTAEDLVKWGHCVANSDLYDPFTLGYPYGWARERIDDQLYLFQQGANHSGYKSYMGILLDSDIVVVVLSNQDSNLWPRWGEDLIRMAVGEDVTPPTPITPVVWPTSKLASLEGHYASADSDKSYDLILKGDHLWLSMDGFPVHRYLTPISENRLTLRDFTGDLEFDFPREAGAAPSFDYILPPSWGGKVVEYRRESTPQ